jgi:hypothetical protein
MAEVRLQTAKNRVEPDICVGSRGVHFCNPTSYFCNGLRSQRSLNRPRDRRRKPVHLLFRLRLNHYAS